MSTQQEDEELPEYICEGCTKRFKDRWDMCPSCGGRLKEMSKDVGEDGLQHEPLVRPLPREELFSPDEGLQRIMKGRKLLEQKEFQAAQECFEEVLSRGSDSWIGWQHLGNLHARTGSLEKARECFQEAVKLRPKEPTSLIDLMWVLGHLVTVEKQRYRRNFYTRFKRGISDVFVVSYADWDFVSTRWRVATVQDTGELEFRMHSILFKGEHGQIVIAHPFSHETVRDLNNKDLLWEKLTVKNHKGSFNVICFAVPSSQFYRKSNPLPQAFKGWLELLTSRKYPMKEQLSKVQEDLTKLGESLKTEEKEEDLSEEKRPQVPETAAPREPVIAPEPEPEPVEGQEEPSAGNCPGCGKETKPSWQNCQWCMREL